MKINVSKGLKIAGQTYKVKSGGEINLRLKEGSYYGKTNNTEREILVDNSVPKEQLSNSIIHETIHAIDACFDTRLSESQVKRLANGFHQVMEQFNINFTAKDDK